ncbi:MAG: amidohydrolase [Gemmatimonadetes bacterium]|nr:amidohydrolase [Gemmatimonadota bacterium]
MAEGNVAGPDPDDLLIKADRLFTPDGESAADSPVAVRIRGGRISAIGSPSTIPPAGARVLDLPGATLTPGFGDAHIHLTEWALTRREIDLSASRSAEAAAHMVRERAPEDREWVRGRGWNANLWTGTAPHRALLDAHFPDRPVVLQSHDMHALWVNSTALERSGIGEDSPDPTGGRIVRDPEGRPTGLLLETACEIVTAVLPRPGLSQIVDAVLEAQAKLHEYGITAVHALPAIHVPEPEPLAPLEAVRASGRLRLRVLQHLPLRMLDEATRIGLRSGFSGDWITIGGVKMFLDGTLGSRTAWLRRPYEGSSDDHGVCVLEPGEFRFHVRRAAAAGIATTVHAIGDAAVTLAFETLADPAFTVNALPHRIEHVQCCPLEHTGTPARARIICSMQPAHLITDWRSADRHWGAERSARTYAFRTLLDAGATLAFGSDAPVEPVDPRLGLFAAVARQDTTGLPASGWFPEQRLTIREALRGYTRGPALAAGHAARGRLAVGSHADIAVWNRDPLGCEADELLGLRCVATIVAGEIVHS